MTISSLKCKMNTALFQDLVSEMSLSFLKRTGFANAAEIDISNVSQSKILIERCPKLVTDFWFNCNGNWFCLSLGYRYEDGVCYDSLEVQNIDVLKTDFDETELAFGWVIENLLPIAVSVQENTFEFE